MVFELSTHFIRSMERRGVCGNEKHGCSSIIVKQPLDYEAFSLFTYKATSRQGAKALFYSYKNNIPIRVFRVSNGTSSYAPSTDKHVAHRFDGLFHIIYVTVEIQGIKQDVVTMPKQAGRKPYCFILYKGGLLDELKAAVADRAAISRVLEEHVALAADQCKLITLLASMLPQPQPPQPQVVLPQRQPPVQLPPILSPLIRVPPITRKQLPQQLPAQVAPVLLAPPQLPPLSLPLRKRPRRLPPPLLFAPLQQKLASPQLSPLLLPLIRKPSPKRTRKQPAPQTS
jgi:hypothetical protein